MDVDDQLPYGKVSVVIGLYLSEAFVWKFCGEGYCMASECTVFGIYRFHCM